MAFVSPIAPRPRPLVYLKSMLLHDDFTMMVVAGLILIFSHRLVIDLLYTCIYRFWSGCSFLFYCGGRLAVVCVLWLRTLPGLLKCSVPISQAYIVDVSQGGAERSKNLVRG